MSTNQSLSSNNLWGNAIEIVKCLRDGIADSSDAQYKTLCLKIIASHFATLDEYLNLLPRETCKGYKGVLHRLANESESESESESEESDTESETSDDDPLWNEIPDYAWDYSNAEWISELYAIKEDKQKRVSERVELMMAKIASFEEEIASHRLSDE